MANRSFHGLNVFPALIALRYLVIVLGYVAGLAVEIRGSNWPQYRGPAGDGHADTNRVPTEWSEQQNVKWKTAVHDRGWSSPVIWGKRIWMTTGKENGSELFAVCLDADTGKVVHDLKLFTVDRPQFIHQFNSPASPTPVLEEGRAYITFGSPGTACLDDQGKVLWQRRDIECNHYRGAGSSPIIYRDLLIMNFDGSDHQFVIALDKRTGKTVWKSDRSIDHKDLGPDGKPLHEGDLRKAFATCHVAEFGGKPLLISQGAKAAYGYDPLTGKEFWRVEERSSHSAGTRPVVGAGVIFLPTGWAQGQVLAIKPGGTGDVTGSHVAWRLTKSVPKKPSLLVHENLLYLINDGGVATAVDPKSGEIVWTERIGGNYSASPIAANGNIYLCSEEGKTTVLGPGREFKKIAENKLDGGFMSSPGVTDNALILRTKTHVYRIEK